MARRGESIYKRKDGRWEARYSKTISADGKTKLISVYAKSYSEVKNKRNEAMLAALAEVSVYNDNDPALNVLLWEWMAFKRTQIKASSLQKYEGLIKNHIKNDIGYLRVSEISNTILLKYAQQQLQTGNHKSGGPLSAKSVNSILSLIASAISHTKGNLPSLKIPFIKEPRQNSPQIFSPAEQAKLEAYIKNNINGYTLGIYISLCTGMRLGEVCALRHEDIIDGVIYVHHTMQRLKSEDGSWQVVISQAKTLSSQRHIPVPSQLAAFLDVYGKETGFVLEQTSGKYIEPRLLQKWFAIVLNRVGLTTRPYHSLRHTFATRLIDQGCDPKTVSELLGHSNVQITLNRYVHPSMEMKKKAINTM